MFLSREVSPDEFHKKIIIVMILILVATVVYSILIIDLLHTLRNQQLI